MSKLTNEQLKLIMPNTPKAKRESALPILNEVATAYDISNERRLAAWLATLAVESGELKYQEELASGDAYDTRTDLGNTAAKDGDGRLYKGHGRIQITGKDNHRSYTNFLRKKGHLPFIDFVAEPQKLAKEPYATDAAGWFFAEKIKANPLADKGDFLAIQIKVNGRNRRTGLPNHWNERNKYWIKALSVLPDNFQLTKDSAADSPATTSNTKQTSGQSPTLLDLQKEPPPSIENDPPPAIEVAAVVAAPTEPPPLPKEDVVSRISNRLLAIPAAMVAALTAVGSWAVSAPINIVISLVIATAAIIIIYFIIHSLRNAGKEKREAAVKLEQERRDNELKVMREQQAFELQKLTLESAMRRDLNAVTIVAPPVATIPNSDSETD